MNLLLLASVLPLVIAIHELGHVAGGWLAGFRFVLLMVGPVRLERSGGKLNLSWRRIPGAGGLAISIPQSDRNIGRGLVLHLAGGPIFSLASAALFMAGSAQIFRCMALLSLLFGLISLVPLSPGGLHSDGSRLWMLLRRGGEARRFTAVSALTGAYLSGTRPRQWSADLVRAASLGGIGSYDEVSGVSLAYWHALDGGRTRQAGELLDRLLRIRNGWPFPFQQSLLCEAAYFEARHRWNPATARRWIEAAEGGGYVEPASWRRAEAAILNAEGRTDEGARQAADGRAYLGGTLDGMQMAESEWLEELTQSLSAIAV